MGLQVQASKGFFASLTDSVDNFCSTLTRSTTAGLAHIFFTPFLCRSLTYDKLGSYTAIFHKQERVNGKLLEEETILLKFKKPFKMYMKWIKDPYKGREVLYVEGWNENQIKVHEGGITGIVTLNLNPGGFMAMKGNRHPVTDTGIGHLIKIIGENLRRRMKAGEFKLLEHGEETVYRRKTRKVEVLFERDRTKGYYGYRVIVNLDKEKKVPIKIQIYDWDDQLVESYG